MSQPRYQIVCFNAEKRPPVQDLAKLHAELLPTSPVSLLGRQFMQHFYYRFLPRDGLIFGAVAYVDDIPVGFIVATADATGFMSTALRHHWLYLGWILAWSILREPKCLIAVWEALQIMRHQPPIPKDAAINGELLSLGVLPVYRSPRFIKQTGLRIAHDLVQTAVAQLKAQGIPLIRAIVDADNTEAKFFYLGMGWELDRTSVPGWKVATVEFVCQP
ncbi:MAG: hypothetical protein NW224_06585 [Leptolyngbyaceae cyanobacterium bins.302]|nr:hypothetical protein [Leptolyngbyaceae cyanobacterium bins.302]